MGTENSGINPDLLLTDMSTNMIIRINSNSTVDAKVTPPKKYNDARIGSIYINGTKYTTIATEFEQIYPR